MPPRKKSASAAVPAPAPKAPAVRKADAINALVLALHRIGAVKFGTFTLKSGLESPIYIDLRELVSHPELLQETARLMWDEANTFTAPGNTHSDGAGTTLTSSASTENAANGGVALAQSEGENAETKSSNTRYQLLCGVPYTALPIATVMSLAHNVPMVMRRKEVKSYGTGKLIEGSWKPGDNCLVVEDLVTSAASVLETVAPLTANDSGIAVTDVVVLIDREQGGAAVLRRNGIRLHAVLTITTMMQVLKKESLLEQDVIDRVFDFIKNNQVGASTGTGAGAKISPSAVTASPPAAVSTVGSMSSGAAGPAAGPAASAAHVPAVAASVDAATTGNHGGVTSGPRAVTVSSRLNFPARHALHCHPVTQSLFELMCAKKSNLCLSADVTTTEDLLAVADAAGPYIAVLKTHVDILSDFTSQVTEALSGLAIKHGYVIFLLPSINAEFAPSIEIQCHSNVYYFKTYMFTFVVVDSSCSRIVSLVTSVTRQCCSAAVASSSPYSGLT